MPFYPPHVSIVLFTHSSLGCGVFSFNFNYQVYCKIMIWHVFRLKQTHRLSQNSAPVLFALFACILTHISFGVCLEVKPSARFCAEQRMLTRATHARFSTGTHPGPSPYRTMEVLSLGHETCVGAVGCCLWWCPRDRDKQDHVTWLNFVLPPGRKNIYER